MVEQFEAKVEKKFLSIDEKLADLDKEVGLVSDDGKKESKEKQEKLELEKENYKISSLSQDQKDKMKIGEIVDGWTKEKAKAEIN